MSVSFATARYTRLVILLCSGWFSLLSQAKEQVIVGVYDYEPLIYMNDQHQPDGFFIDLLNHLAATLDWQLIYQYGNWNELMKMLDAGQIDLLPGMFKTPEREKLFRFPSESVVTDWGQIYIPANQPMINNLFELDRRALGRLQGDAIGLHFAEQMRSFGINVRLIDFDSYEHLLAAVQAGKIDAAVASRIFGGFRASYYGLLATPIIFNPQQGYFPVGNHASHLIPLLNRELFKLKVDKASIFYRAFDKRFTGTFKEQRITTNLMFALAILGALLITLGFIIRYLNHRVARRTEELREANDRLSELNRSLDLMVKSRTHALEKANHELADSLHSLQEMQEQLIESEKMSSLGSLVAGVAHEINTPIGLSITSASLLAEKLKELQQHYQAGSMSRSQLERFLALADESTQILQSNLGRAADLIQSFKRIAVDQSNQDIRELALQHYLEEVLLSLRPTLKKNHVAVILSCDPDLRWRTCPGALAQIVTNIVMNAVIHAYPPEQEIKNVSMQLEHQGKLLFWTIQDNGQGVKTEQLEHLFEPFYTTKRGQGGSGLGLHLVYNLVSQQLKGSIHVSSPAGSGLKYEIRLPELRSDTDG
ncbi:ATP-binding protein [Balneatrix alpica]|uniref:histidine kinase n=1 Tax=Balneatrix alpica TaxID=75684 RepID=A0ABV5ZE89_9GAMM|nr:transporter substrate-binding domain-containing protein [Balneatrix alpica]